jgi:membrane fusion protein, multidrug efflux system
MKCKAQRLVATAVLYSFLLCPAFAQTLGLAEETPEAEQVRGVVRSQEEAWLSSDLGLPVKLLPFKESESFKKGDVLIGFDCATLQAQYKSAKAKYRAEELGYQNNLQLKSHNAAGQFDVDVSKAKAEAAAADMEAIAASLERCEITAPFDGQIAQLAVHLHETPDRGARVMRILDSSALEVDMIVPSDWLKWVREGADLSLAIDELGTETQAQIVRISAQVDAVSQTVKVVGRIARDNDAVRPGMSGDVTFLDRP